MKKLLALILSVLMTMSLFALPVSAEAALPAIAEGDAIYAGEQSITIKLAQEVEEGTTALTAEQEDLIKITNLKTNEEIDFTNVITGDVLTLIPEESFEINKLDATETTTYKLQLGNKTKLFTVDEFWVPNFVGDAEAGTVTDLYIEKGNGIVIDVVNNDTIILGSNAGVVYLNCDDLLTKENVSLVADVYYTGGSKQYSSVFGFNVLAKKAGLLHTNNKVSAAGWVFKTRQDPFYYNTHVVTIGNEDSTANVASYGYNNTTEGGDHSAFLDENLNPAYTSTNFGTDYVASTTTIGTDGLDAEADAGTFNEETKYHYAIDKMGEVATLMIRGQLVDVLDTQAIYDTKSAGTAPKAGYFTLATWNNTYNRKTIYANIKLITSSVREIATGTISVESVSAEEEMITVKFASDGNSVDVSAVENIYNYIELSEGDYDIISAEGDTLVLKVKNISYEPSVITVKKDFGYDSLRVAEDITVDYQFIAREGDVVLESFNGNYNTITLDFNIDMTDAKNVDDKIKLLLNGSKINFTTVIDGEKITLNLNESLKADVIYDLVIEEGLGYEKVTLKNRINKYIVIETIKNVTFDGGVSLDYITTYDNNKMTGEDIPYTTVRNGKLYVKNGDYLTLYFDKLGLENYEDYIMSFDLERYGSANTDILHLNVPKSSSGIAYYTNTLKGIGWRVRSGEWHKYMHWGVKSKTYTSEATPGGTLGGYLSEKFTLEENDGDVTLPEGQPVVTNYVIEKTSAHAKLFVNGQFIDALDMNEMLSGWNNSYPDNQVSEVPTKGIFVYSSFEEKNKSCVAFDNMIIAQFKEYTDGETKVTEENKTINGNTASGNITVRNFMAEGNKKMAVVVTAYGENNKFLGVKKVLEETLAPGQSAQANYSFTASEEIKDISTELVDDTMISKTTEISVTSAFQTDFDNNIITIKGKIKPESKDRTVYMLMAKDNGFVTPWAGTAENDGNLTIVNIPADAESFEYSFKYKEIADLDPYKMSIYAIVWNNGIELKRLATYNYAKNEDVLAFAETVKTTKTTFVEVEKYAQSLGIDLSFADTEYEQKFLVDTIYDERETITGKDDLASIIEKAKARMEMLSNIHKNASTAALVNKEITSYASLAALDLTKYNALTSAQKVIVCTSFIYANYEELGYAEFLKAFNIAVQNASETKVPSGGGGGGGGGGGYVAPTPVIPSGIEVTVDPDEYTEKPSVEIIGKQSFADMDEYGWAKEAVEILSDKGVVSGIGNNMFNPEGTVTREQIAKMVVSVLNELDNDAKAEYGDVDASGWAYKFIASAKKSGLMNGISDTEFAPLSAVTREDLAVILYRASLKQDKKYEVKKSGFTDFTEISEYAKEAVEYMAGAGIINGFEDGSFNPKAPATRAQAAVLIYKALIGGDK